MYKVSYILLLLRLVSLGLSQKCENGSEWSWGRYNIYNTKGKTIADLVKEDDSWSEAAGGIIEFANLIGQRRIDGDKYLSCLKHDLLAGDESEIAAGKMGIWGFGELDECVVDIEWDLNEKIEEERAAEKIFQHLSIFDEKLISNNTAEILQDYEGIEKKNWTHLDTISRFQMDGPADLRTCEVFKLVTFRNDSEWNIDAAFTNFDSKIKLPNFERWYGGELLAFNGSQVQESRERVLDSCDLRGNSLGQKTGTFNIEVWEGKPVTHALITEKTEDNQAIIEALDKSNLRTEIIAESRLASSIAILFLPSALALFPVSLFQETSFPTSFVYSLATDVLSIIPVVIKGSELIYFGRSKQWKISTRFYGAADTSEPAMAIHWIAYCSMKQKILVQGILYVCVGLFMMCFGVVLEIIGSRKLGYMRTKWVKDNADNYNAHLLENAGLIWFWKYNSDHREPRYAEQLPA